MSQVWTRLKSDEQGISLVFVSLSLVSLFSVSMLAIDLGMVMTARAQAQNSADAASQAGAVALFYNDYNDRSTSGPAVQNALAAGRANQVMGATVSLLSSDVTFVNDGSGQPNWVRVNVFRTAGRGNPLATLVAPYFGTSNTDVTATATAEAAPANAATCMLPFGVADKWTERQTPGGWHPTDTFNAYPTGGSTLGDIYAAATAGGYTGFKVSDKGLQLTIKVATTQISSSHYYAFALPGSSGATDYTANIANCSNARINIFSNLSVEGASMASATKQGIDALIAKDPSAYWDSSARKVVSSMNPSPRVRLMPVFDPYYFQTGKQNGHPADFKAANFIGIFIEGMSGNDVIARIVPAAGVINTSAGPAPSGAFPRVIRIVQ